ncbi:MAG: type II secretion system protein N [Steroidobacteraceae bacterium]
MHRGRIWLIVLAVIVFATIVVARLPLRWLLPALPTGLACASAAGSLWHGACDGFSVDGQTLGDLRWQLRPASLLRARLDSDFQLVRERMRIMGRLQLSPGGALTLLDTQALLPLERAYLPALPADLGGQADVLLRELQWRDGKVLVLQGEADAHDLRQPQSGAALGNYHVDFPETRAEPRGTLRDDGGPLEVNGEIVLTGEPGFTVNALVRARADAAPQLQEQLRYLGLPDAAGRYSLSIAGTF